MNKYINLISVVLVLVLMAFGNNANAQATNQAIDGKLSKNSSGGIFTNNTLVNPASDKNDNYVAPTNSQFNQGNWQRGKTILDAGLEKYPKYSDLRMLLGKYYLHFKQYDQARYELKKALEYNPDNLDAKKLLVNLETQTKRYSSAICYVNELLQVNPYWKGLWQQKISLYELQGNNIEADRLRKRLLQIYPNDAEVKKDYVYNTEMEANTEIKNGNVDEAIALNKEVMQNGSRSVESYLNIINSYLKAGDVYNALAYTERGLNQFPHNKILIDKRAGILASQNRYDELLPFLKKEGMAAQYNYYLLQAARNAKDQDPATLYGKVLERNPGNEEAFNYVFTHAVSDGQYQEALNYLKKYQAVKGNSKKLDIDRLMVYEKMGNTSKVFSLTKQLFNLYPNDSALQREYVNVMVKEAQNDMAAAQYQDAINCWYQVLQLGDSDLAQVAQTSIYKAYLASGQYDKALNSLNELISNNPQDKDLYTKAADLYYKQGQYYNAVTAYEKALGLADNDHKSKYLSGYAELQTKIVKSLIEDYKYPQAIQYVNRWLAQDSINVLALQYAINLSILTHNETQALSYAKEGLKAYPDNTYFKVKIAEVTGEATDSLEQVYGGLRHDLLMDPYNKDLINTFSSVANKYGLQLLHQHKSDEVLGVVDTALIYAPKDSLLKHTKGLAFEQLKKYDSAFYYQSFYKPNQLELNDFKHHLNYLYYKSRENEIGLYHLRSRYGDSYEIQTLSSFQYSRFEGKNDYVGRIDYAGRTTGKGYQIQAQWTHTWDPNTYTIFNAAWANQFFPNFTLNGSVFRNVDLLGGMELQIGAGFRRLDMSDSSIQYVSSRNMSNIVVGATKLLYPFRLNLKLNDFFLGNKQLYNLSFDGRYYLSSPKDYIMAVASVGTSPDVQIIDYSLYNGFSAINTMVGAGMGYMIYKNVAVGVLGTWYNFKSDNGDFRDLYNMYFNVNISF